MPQKQITDMWPELIRGRKGRVETHLIQIERKKIGMDRPFQKPVSKVKTLALRWNLRAKREIGRQKQAWRKSVEEEVKVKVKVVGVKRNELGRTYLNGYDWRSVVTALCPKERYVRYVNIQSTRNKETYVRYVNIKSTRNKETYVRYVNINYIRNKETYVRYVNINYIRNKETYVRYVNIKSRRNKETYVRYVNINYTRNKETYVRYVNIKYTRKKETYVRYVKIKYARQLQKQKQEEQTQDFHLVLRSSFCAPAPADVVTRTECEESLLSRRTTGTLSVSSNISKHRLDY